MRKLFILTAIFALWIICPAASATPSYDPHSTVVIEAHPNMERFIEEKLPEYVKKWPCIKKDAEPTEIFSRWIDIQNYVFSNYRESSLYVVGQGISFTVKVPNRNAEFPITMNEYRFLNEKIFYFHNGQTQEVSIQEFEKIKFTWANKIVESAEYLTNLTTDARDKVVKKIEGQLIIFGTLKAGDSLEEKLAKIDSNIPADELMFIPPKPKFTDFIPKEVVISPMGGDGYLIFGLSLADSGIIYYHPAALINEYNKFGDTSTHEQWHRNIHFQGLLLGSFFDKELWASYIERYGYANSMMFHPYQAPTRKIARVTTGFDIQKAMNDMFDVTVNNIKITDPELFNEYWKETEKIKTNYREIILDRFLPEFYANPFFYACLNDDMQDKNGGYKLFFYAKNAFSLLGGPEKTQEWLMENDNIINEVLKKAKSNLGKDKDKNRQEAKKQDMIISMAKTCARILNISYRNNEDLLRIFNDMLNQGIISLPQIEIHVYDMVEMMREEG